MKLRLCFVAVLILRHAASGFVHSPTINCRGASISCNEWLKTHTTCTTVSAIPSTADSSMARRRLLGGSITTAAAGFLGGGSASNEAAVSIKPLVDMPLRRLQLPKGGVGRDYVVVPLSFAGSDKVEEFLLDTGDALEMVTPSLKTKLGLLAPKTGSVSVEGTTVGGSRSYDIVELVDASVGGMPLPTLHATVLDFPQAHLNPKRDVSGVLGGEFINAFDLDLDFPQGRLRLWPRGETELASWQKEAGLSPVPAAMVPGGVLGVRASGSAKKAGAGSSSVEQQQQQPFLGIVDTGASYTILNTAAANLAGAPSPSDRGKSSLQVRGVGFDGQPITMPLVKVFLELDGNLDRKRGQFEIIASLPEMLVGVGDLPVFPDLLGDPRVPAAILGMDLWSQGRLVILGSAENSRSRTLLWKHG